ncbi:MAG: RT0821/Lpp0805 family surface protein [Hyphomicrobiaceae bacterium]
MRPSSSLFPVLATAFTGLVVTLAIFMVPNLAAAGEADSDTGSATCTCPPNDAKPWSRPKFADLRPSLDVSDEIAALESVQLALSQVGDGSTYVWHRYHGRLSGVVTPTTSFKDSSGAICRHVVVVLTAGTLTRRSEGIACRLQSGQWQLQG